MMRWHKKPRKKASIMKKTLTLFTTLLLSTQVLSAVSLQYDERNKCDLYTIIKVSTDSKGQRVYEHDFAPNEEIINARIHHGMTLQDLEIDFINKEASFEIIGQVTLGFNRNLLGQDIRATISADNSQFNEAINLVNRRILNFTQVCVDRDYRIQYLK